MPIDLSLSAALLLSSLTALGGAVIFLVRRWRAERAGRARAEAAALQNQRRFEDVAGLSSDWIWELDADLRCTYMSPRIQDFTGMPPDFYIGKVPDDATPITTSDSGWPEFRRRLRQHQAFQNVPLWTVHRSTGKAIHYEMSGTPLRDAQGRFRGFRGIGRDRTRDVVSQTALDAILGGVANQVGSDYFVALVSHLARTLDVDIAAIAARAGDGQRLRTLAAWMDGKIIANVEYPMGANPSAEVMSGRFSEYPSGVTEHFPDPWLRKQNIEAYVGVPLFDPAGATLGELCLLKRTPVRNPDVVRAVLRALAPRASAELRRQLADEQAREAEQRLRSIVDTMSSGLLVKVDNRYTITNRTFAHWVGIPVAELIGMEDVELFRRMGWGEAVLAEADAVQREAMATGEVQIWENTARYGDGRVRDAIITAFPIPGASREVAAVGLLITDVTELRRAERHLLQSQKMEALGRLAGGVAHDFNNIVGAIAGYARFIAQDTPETSSPHRHAERILAASTRAKQLIQQILAFSRRTGANRQSVAVAAALGETVALLKATLPGSTRIEVGPVPPGTFVKADPAQLDQVLLNICVNASDALAGRPGRIDISARRQDGIEAADYLRQSSPVVERDGGLRLVVGAPDPSLVYVVLRIADTGSGIDRDLLESVFEPFFTTKPAGHGTGLGLAVVHGIVLNHGGAIAVTSRSGTGTAFEIWFPEAIAAEGKAPTPVSAPAGRGRILVVDDDADFGDMVATSMERLGYEVVVADRGADAVQAVEEDPHLWNLVITDHTMPDLTGLDVIARIKRRRPDLPCILCTGYGRDVTETAARAAGASDFVAKPVDPILLGQRVGRLIG
jgi:PAS domain S-box-containing protein